MEHRRPKGANIIDVLGLLVEAPAFTPETFAAGVAKAQAAGYFHIVPARTPGTVLIDTANTNGAAYAVTRHACSCMAGQTHGHCYHRAGAIYISEFYGIDLCRTEILGFDDGEPVTAAERAAQLQEVA